MLIAYYVSLIEGHRGALDRIGGLPHHRPPEIPKSWRTGDMTFLMQLYCEGRLALPGALCIQLYQDAADSDPTPTVVVVPTSAPLNSNEEGRANPDLLPHDIAWEQRNDPDVFPNPRTDSDEEYEFAQSKCGGVTYYWSALEDGDTFLAQIREGPENFKFGGYTAVIVRDRNGELKARLC